MFTMVPGALFETEPCIKGTVSVISGNPASKDEDVRIPMVPLKALSDQVRTRYQCL